MGHLPPDARVCRALRRLRRDMQIVFQDPFGSLSPRMTVGQIIAEGLGVHGVEKGRDPRQMVAEIMAEVGLDAGAMDRYPHEFSGGMKQCALIAIGLNVVVGQTGLLDLGYVGFYAVGAYTVAILTSPSSPPSAPTAAAAQAVMDAGSLRSATTA